eukprot:362051-Chlamydomonas_euryale.AAC.2
MSVPLPQKPAACRPSHASANGRLPDSGASGSHHRPQVHTCSKYAFTLGSSDRPSPACAMMASAGNMVPSLSGSDSATYLRPHKYPPTSPSGAAMGEGGGSHLVACQQTPRGVPTDTSWRANRHTAWRANTPLGMQLDTPRGVPTDTPRGLPTDTPRGVPTDTLRGVPTDTPCGVLRMAHPPRSDTNAKCTTSAEELSAPLRGPAGAPPVPSPSSSSSSSSSPPPC